MLKPFTDEDRKRIEKMLHLGTFRPLERLGFGMFLTFAINALLRWLIPPLREGGRPLWTFLASLLVAIGLVRRFHRRHRRLNTNLTLETELKEGLAEVTNFRATDAIEVTEYEDEGFTYYIKLAPDGVLFLQGQYLYDYPQFPCPEFQITRTPKSKIVLNIQCAGERFSKLRKREPFTDGEFQQNKVPEDGSVLSIDFESIKSAAE